MKQIALVLAVVLCLCSVSVGAYAAQESITVYNWYDYIDESVIRDFEKETGIKVKYANFTTNEEMYARLSTGAGEYDVIFPSDYIIERMIKEEGLAKLNLDNMPNVSGIIEWMKTPDYDPTGEYSVAYMWGTVGILYNPDMIDEITSWDSIFDPANKKSVFMLNSIRDSIGIALKALGYSLNTRDANELQAAKELLIKQKADGIVKGYMVDEIKDKMISGEAAMGIVWSGDALYAMGEEESLRYVVPDEGSNIWVDGMCVPANSKNIQAAEAFIDYLCRPDIAQRNMEYIWYSTPIQSVVDDMDEETKANETINPPQSVIDRCEFFHDIVEDMDLYGRIWTEVKAG